jgi:hypothetical protein
MKSVLVTALTVILLVHVSGGAQAPATKSVLGTVVSFNKDANSLDIRPDNAAPVAVKLMANTVVQKIAPGETDLKRAATITASDLAVGDRVLATLASNGSDALRVVVISATDIAKRDDADRQDWATRGFSGVVASKTGNQILLRPVRTPTGDLQQAISTSDKTKFRRYSPDSVKFADAKISKFDEIAAGDQIRARGEKSADGRKVEAEEVVFGTFLTKAGSVVSIDPASREITVKEIGSGKSFTVKLTADSSIKQMPVSPADGRGAPPAGAPAGPPAGGPAGANVAQIVDRLPAGKFDDIKTGASVVVSSTKGSEADKVTAILLVTNADLLIRMASTPSGRGGTLVFGTSDGGGLGGLALQ